MARTWAASNIPKLQLEAAKELDDIEMLVELAQAIAGEPDVGGEAFRQLASRGTQDQVEMLLPALLQHGTDRWINRALVVDQVPWPTNDLVALAEDSRRNNGVRQAAIWRLGRVGAHHHIAVLQRLEQVDGLKNKAKHARRRIAARLKLTQQRGALQIAQHPAGGLSQPSASDADPRQVIRTPASGLL